MSGFCWGYNFGLADTSLALTEGGLGGFKLGTSFSLFTIMSEKSTATHYFNYLSGINSRYEIEGLINTRLVADEAL